MDRAVIAPGRPPRACKRLGGSRSSPERATFPDRPVDREKVLNI
jgi:hypothetical protein